jgi:hypothetical protein
MVAILPEEVEYWQRRYETDQKVSTISSRACRTTTAHPAPSTHNWPDRYRVPCHSRQTTLDAATIITRHLRPLRPLTAVADDAAVDSNTDRSPAPWKPRSPSTAALRSADGHRRRQLPHKTSPKPRRNQDQQQLGAGTKSGDFHLATTGDHELAVDRRSVDRKHVKMRG